MDTEDTRVVQWLEENQEDSYRLEVRGDVKLASIFMVPKTMKGNDVIYTPQEDNFFGGVIHGARDYYGDAQFLKKLNEETFAMMLFRDASFLLVFLAHHVANKNGRPYQQQSDSNGGSPFHGLKSVYSKSRKAVGQRPTNGWFPFTWFKNHSLCLRRNSSNRNSKRVYKKKQDPSRLFGSNVLPSALRLSKAGVKFRHYEGGIEQIRFDKAQSTLYLPLLKIGIMTETIIRNLIVFELCSSESEENAVTSFARLLEELTVDAKDAELLRRNGILVNWVGGDDKMVEIVKSLSSSTWKPYFKPVNDARSSLKTYYSTRTWKILWSEFLDTYCSKPWVLISAVAAAVLLVMTGLQVLCFFYTCNKNAEIICSVYHNQIVKLL
ncbi:hypothetical protein SUGI_0917100 [Cryptomeria japonica]|nr:hypothetical protein SUGI_0917100 [Cryptomeria japonica]